MRSGGRDEGLLPGGPRQKKPRNEAAHVTARRRPARWRLRESRSAPAVELRPQQDEEDQAERDLAQADAHLHAAPLPAASSSARSPGDSASAPLRLPLRLLLSPRLRLPPSSCSSVSVSARPRSRSRRARSGRAAAPPAAVVSVPCSLIAVSSFCVHRMAASSCSRVVGMVGGSSSVSVSSSRGSRSAGGTSK